MANGDLIGLLLEGEVHLWWIDLLGIETRNAKKMLEALSSEERENSNLLIFERDRLSYGLAHGLVRFVLSGYTGAYPSSWIFERTAAGRPMISRSSCIKYPDLNFSISHGARFAGCAVTKNATCGFDIESSYRWDSSPSKPIGFLTKTETSILKQAPATSKLCLLNQLWCAKEAYLKAKGTGFATDPASIQLDFEFDKAFCLRNTRVRDDLGWSFHIAPLNSGHHMAAVSRNSGHEPARFRSMSLKPGKFPGSLA